MSDYTVPLKYEKKCSLIFEVENGEINNIFSTKVDSNQVSLFE